MPASTRRRRVAAIAIALLTMPAAGFAVVHTFSSPVAEAVDPETVTRVEGGTDEPVAFPAELERLIAGIDTEPANNEFFRQVPLQRSPRHPGELDMAWPVGSRRDITSPFGPRGDGFHHGLDIGCPTGRSIRAVADGTVVWAKDARVYGTLVGLHHGHGIVTLYAHLSRIVVQEGQPVKGGQVLGLCGSTGRSTGPHLHLEVRWNARAWDPLRLLP